MIGRKHHYIQRAHLELFSSATGKLAICATDGKEFETAAANVFAERDLYSYMSDETHIPDFEALIERIESATFPTMRHIAESGRLAEADPSNLLIYLAVSLLRNPTVQKAVIERHRALILSAAKLLERRGEIKPFEGAGPLSGKRFSQAVDEGLVDIEINNGQYVEAFREHLESIVNVLSGFKFSLLDSEAGLLAIGDHPLTFIHPGFDYGGNGIPLGGRGCELNFPLSSACCLIGRWQRKFRDSKSDLAVHQVNRRQALFASRHLASSKRSPTLKKFMMRYSGVALCSETAVIPSHDGYFHIGRRGLLPSPEYRRVMNDVRVLTGLL